MNLNGNTILITGGSAGIGLALAKKFQSLGNEVLIVGRDAQKLAQAQKDCPQLITYPCDLSHKSETQELIGELTQKHPELNILINNAGLQYRYSFLEESEILAKTEYEMQVNFMAPIQLTVGLLPLLTKQSEAAIINVSSGLALTPKEDAPIYCASKAALRSFTQGLRYQLKNTSIKVFEILPPRVDTAMQEGQKDRGMPAEKLVEEFIPNFRKNKLETYVGIVKYFSLILRFAPSLAKRILNKRSRN